MTFAHRLDLAAGNLLALKHSFGAAERPTAASVCPSFAFYAVRPESDMIPLPLVVEIWPVGNSHRVVQADCGRVWATRIELSMPVHRPRQANPPVPTSPAG